MPLASVTLVAENRTATATSRITNSRFNWLFIDDEFKENCGKSILKKWVSNHLEFVGEKEFIKQQSWPTRSPDKVLVSGDRRHGQL